MVKLGSPSNGGGNDVELESKILLFVAKHYFGGVCGGVCYSPLCFNSGGVE